MVYAYNGAFFNRKKEQNSDPCYNLHEPQKQYVE